MYTYLDVLEAWGSAKFCKLGAKDVVQCFVMKHTIGKCFSLKKEAFSGISVNCSTRVDFMGALK